jgi:hypothetical protein
METLKRLQGVTPSCLSCSRTEAAFVFKLGEATGKIKPA